MNRLHRILGALLLLWSHHAVLGQADDLRIGQWRSHLPYNSGLHVTQSATEAFYATPFSILALDKEDFGVRFLSKVDGLSNVGIRLIKYHAPSETLIVVYNNSVIDLVEGNSVLTLNQIKNFSNLTGEKRINNIFVENDSMIYLAASYGISKLNLAAREFVFTVFTGIDVQDVGIFDGGLFMATEEGIYRTDTGNPNPEDFSLWQLLGAESGFPGDYSSGAFANYNGDFYVDVAGELYRIAPGTLAPVLVHTEASAEIAYITSEGPQLLVGYRCLSSSVCGNGKILYFNADGGSGQLPSSCIGSMRHGIQAPDGRLFFGDLFRGFRTLSSVTAANCDLLDINSPWSANSREIAVGDDQVWITGGGVNQTFSNRFSSSGFYSLIEGQWTNYNPSNRTELKGVDLADPGDDLLDFLAVAIHPSLPLVYAGSFFEGLIEFDGENMKLFNDQNSTLSNANGDPLRTRVSGLVFDEDENLWVSNHGAAEPLSVLLSEGGWKQFRPACNRAELHQIDVDDNGFKWIIDGSNQGGVVLFDEGDLNNPNDDRCRTFTENNSRLPTNNTNCLVADLEGVVWVGTTEGIVIFECGDPFDPACTGFLSVFVEDEFQDEEFGEALLSTENIQTIAVDGANRKWIGSRNGIFVLSPDGDEEVLRFTAENSPLFDNNIIDIAIDQQSGEVFIGTNNGVISYRSDAIEGGRVHRSDVKVFPNPVRPDYFGPIAIQGLARDADVKITNITGELVFETRALGGQAIWEGNDYNGRRVNSGVYLVFSSANVPFGSATRPDAAVAKILVIN